MATTLYTTFSSVPANKNARRRLMRAARLGARPAPLAVDYGDAAKVVDAVRAYKDGWQTSAEPLSVTVRAAWAGRGS